MRAIYNHAPERDSARNRIHPDYDHAERHAVTTTLASLPGTNADAPEP